MWMLETTGKCGASCWRQKGRWYEVAKENEGLGVIELIIQMHSSNILLTYQMY